jgi:hypothetical protein
MGRAWNRAIRRQSPRRGIWRRGRLARELLSGRLPVAECAGRTCLIWDFDGVIYPGLPGDLSELVLMCWLHGGEEYDVNGGDKRLLAAARALVSRNC